MSIRRKYRVEPQLDMGPFSDVAFLLIIFFIVTTTMVRPRGRVIDIPSAASEEQKEEKKNLTVSILPGELQFGKDEGNQKEITIPAFRQELSSLDLPSKPEPERMIVVNLSEEVPYERFYEVVTAISRTGGIVTLVEEEEEESP